MKLPSIAALSLTAAVLVYSAHKQYYLLSVLVMPVFCVDPLLRKAQLVSTWVIASVQLFALIQAICIWYLFYINYKSNVFTWPVSDMSDLVSNSIRKGLLNQNLDKLRNASTDSEYWSDSLPTYIYPVTVQSIGPLDNVPSQSMVLLDALFGKNHLLSVDFPDLRYRSSEEIRGKHKLMFSELPQQGFDQGIHNPCWHFDDASRGGDGAFSSHKGGEKHGIGSYLACLPYAYILGQPKCGTSDLYERLKPHQNIIMPRRKEVRWFTRGEFSFTALMHEGSDAADAENEFLEGVGRGEKLLGSHSSIYTFTSYFRDLSVRLTGPTQEASLITIDGGPHTLWWPTQSPDGRYLPDDIPPAQLLRELQPRAKLIIILADPVKRMYSDYYFLDDSLRPVQPGAGTDKSAAHFHNRAKQQIEKFDACIDMYKSRLEVDSAVHRAIQEGGNYSLPIWFRAAQMCAHDRHRFAVAGWGRLGIGLYVLFLEKWLEHFPPDRFLVVRLEDQSADPEGFMRRVFEFLEVGEPDEDAWKAILRAKHANTHRVNRDPIWDTTETMLREFYRPYNELLAKLMEDHGFKWELQRIDPVTGKALSLRDALLEEQRLAVPSSAQEERKRVVIEQLKLGGHHQAHHHLKTDDHIIDGSLGEGHGHEGAAAINHGNNPALSDRLNYIKYHMNDLKLHRQADKDGDVSSKDSPHGPIFDAHGFNRHQLGDHDADDQQSEARHGAPFIDSMQKSLRGFQLLGDLDLRPMRFSIDGLHNPSNVSSDQDEAAIIIKDKEDAASQLCEAAFSLDIVRLKRLLYDIGVPGDLVSAREAGRNALHCLSLLFVMADAHRYSHVFSVLKGKESWMTKFFDPPLEMHQSSVLSRDIISRLDKYIIMVAEWLLRADVPVNIQDRGGLTPLHIASIGGELSLVQLLLDNGADTSITADDERTALHYAVVYGRAEIASLLVDHGADLFLEDRYHVRPIDVLENPGPVTKADALKYLNITQRPTKKIDRLLHPEDHPDDDRLGWRGDGGWNSTRLKGFENDMECEGIDQYHADDLTYKDLFSKYIARNAPVLIRGLIRQWPVVEDYEYDRLLRSHAELQVQVSDIPYADKFGGSEHIDMRLGEYIQEVRSHRMVGGSHPWYVFLGNPIPRLSEVDNSLVRYDRCPTPDMVQLAFERINPPSSRGLEGSRSRLVFINAQWAFGGEATGAPVHYHNSAWNGLIYGAKKWIVYPPHDMIMSNKQIYDYYETDMREYAARGVQPITCVQTAGDVMIIPESWGHGVLNIQESIAIATESKTPMFRLKPQTKLMNKFKAAPPRDDRPADPRMSNRNAHKRN